MSSPRPSDDYRTGDVVMGDRGQFFLAEWDGYAKQLRWVPLIPIAESQTNPPSGAVLMRRLVDGKPLPVTDLGDGELFAVRHVEAS